MSLTSNEIQWLVDVTRKINAQLPEDQQPGSDLRNHFSEGVYLRELRIPKGNYGVGKIHKTRHLNLIVSGECTIWTNHGKMRLKGPAVFESLADEQKVAYAHTDVVYMTIHPNPDNETDMDVLEGRFIHPEEQPLLFTEMASERLFHVSGQPKPESLLEHET